jgi:signal transduction histidine kinase
MIKDVIIAAMDMPLSIAYRRLLRAAGVLSGCWLYLSLLNSPSYVRDEQTLKGRLLWDALWACFLLTLWASTAAGRLFERNRFYLLTLEISSAFCLHWLRPDANVAFLALIVTWQLILFFPPKIAFAWIVAHFLLYLVVDAHSRPFTKMTLASMTVYFCFKLCTCGLILMAKREGVTRQHQTIVIAELKATQEALAEASRLSERLRIASELHDTLGHGLTALSLHLEVAMNEPRLQPISTHVLKAQTVARGMLSEVRSVVGSLRQDLHADDLSAALTSLTSDVPGLNVHLSKPDVLEVNHSGQAHTVVRCVQEIITNTLKHANAKNLWLSMRLEKGQLVLTALDDGLGSKESKGNGAGLAIMKERFQSFGGKVEILSDPTQGFCVTASLPVLKSAVM